MAEEAINNAEGTAPIEDAPDARGLAGGIGNDY